MNSKVLVLVLNYKSYQDTINYTYNILNQKNINVDVLIVDNDSQNSSFENLSKSNIILHQLQKDFLSLYFQFF